MKEFELFRFEKEFVDACGRSLKESLSLIGCKFEPNVFLIGFYPKLGVLRVVPDTHELELNDFEKYLSGLVGEIPPFPDDLRNSEATEAEWAVGFRGHHEYLSACSTAFREFSDEHFRQNSQMVIISPCREANGQIVAVVATWGRHEYERYPHLEDSILTQHGRWPSLHYAVIDLILHRFSEELSRRDAGRRFRFETDSVKEIVRTAGALFLQSHALFGKGFSLEEVMGRSAFDFFEACNAVAGMPYESREGFGSMVVSKPGHIAAGTVIELENPFPLTERRRVRKFLEMCREELWLLTDSETVWGWAKYNENLHFTVTADVITVRFVGQSLWQVLHRNDILMEVLHGEPRLARPPADPEEVESKILAKFPDLFLESARLLTDLIKHAMKAQHGAMLIISANADTEAARLTRSTKGIKPFSPNEATISAASAIDGGILVDLKGTCHGIGIILDGEAGDGENPARGARYNSAIRYLRRHPDSLIAVISEDKTVDIVTIP